MDKILEGLVTSSHPLNLKKVVVKKVVESAENSVSEEQCKAMFSLTTRLILEGQDPFQKQVGHQVLEAYARYHRSEFENYFNRNFVLSLLQEGYRALERKDVAILDYIHNGLKLIMSCPSILDIFSVLQVEVLRIVCERPEPSVAARLSELLTDFVQCIPKGKMSIAFCQQLVRTIGHFQCISTYEKKLREYVSQVTKVSSLLQNIWKVEPCTLLPSLQEVFAIISSTDASFEPSVSLASLVQHIPLQLITVLIRSLTTDPNVKDASMTQALCRMIDWLSWPLAQHVETWVIALLKGLAAVQKFTILIDVTLQKIELVFHRLWFPLVRPGALAVLSHMLLSFQHSPEAFHMVVPHVVSLVQSFKNVGHPTSTTFLAEFAELMHCMIYHYSGFPDLYEPILEALKDLLKPSEEKMKLTLNQSAWTSQSSTLASLPRLSGKSETGKTGLINLGNTCYMNSVLQALFMATDFRRQVLSLNLNGTHSLMKKLQHLFAFLAHTQREAYAPQIFFDASRPPWFTPRSQQDCSEYLRFLLDRLDEEEKTIKALCSKLPSDAPVTDCSVVESSASVSDDISNHYCTKESKGCGNKEKTLIEHMFGGKLQTNICCLNCRSTSQKREAFTDLSLAFCPTLVDKPVQSTLDSPKQKDDDCIEIDITPSVEAPSILAPSTEDVTVRPAKDKSEYEVKMNDNCVLDNSECANAVESANMSAQNNRREKTISVTDLLNYFLAPEILDGDNQYYCEKCASLQNAEKTMQIMEEPEYLILTLLRFSYDPKCHVRRKITDNVSIPLVLDLPIERTTSSTSPADWAIETNVPDVTENLAKKLKPSNTEDLCCTRLVPYVLSSVVVHSGTSSESGHYYSYARNVTSSERCLYAEKSCYSHGQLVGRETGSSVMTHNDAQCNDVSKDWFLFNDSRVTFTSFQSVFNITSRFPKDTAYVLIYRKHNLGDLNRIQSSSANGLWVNGEPPLQKDLLDAITKDNLLYLQEQELNARTRALQNTSASCSFRPNGFDDNDPPGSCGPSGGGGDGGFSTLGRLVF
ncbi:ubiquitin specific peptidase 38 L homeolog isoform X1 [Xenopus laevis]|uniref:Ubiquitin specific peptidase 38 L homeolog isoform X1 n=1 Tax=Xenopus laevis TaxID=8355 RepID=A0A8J1M7S5_XENLA|nr:ubiquitin specific peptidase 38 L homeolog isoform X1 [Xenopus laevis]